MLRGKWEFHAVQIHVIQNKLKTQKLFYLFEKQFYMLWHLLHKEHLVTFIWLSERISLINIICNK